jgi:hypothetical protein
LHIQPHLSDFFMDSVFSTFPQILPFYKSSFLAPLLFTP